MFLHLLVVNKGFKTSLEIEFNSVQARGELIIPGGAYIRIYYFFSFTGIIWAHNWRGGLLRCLPTLVQANRRDTKGYPGFSVENDMLRVNGLVLGGGLPIFVLIFAVADVTLWRT